MHAELTRMPFFPQSLPGAAARPYDSLWRLACVDAGDRRTTVTSPSLQLQFIRKDGRRLARCARGGSSKAIGISWRGAPPPLGPEMRLMLQRQGQKPGGRSAGPGLEPWNRFQIDAEDARVSNRLLPKNRNECDRDGPCCRVWCARAAGPSLRPGSCFSLCHDPVVASPRLLRRGFSHVSNERCAYG
jgi:hypothetical protein